MNFDEFIGRFSDGLYKDRDDVYIVRLSGYICREILSTWLQTWDFIVIVVISIHDAGPLVKSMYLLEGFESSIRLLLYLTFIMSLVALE